MTDLVPHLHQSGVRCGHMSESRRCVLDDGHGHEHVPEAPVEALVRERDRYRIALEDIARNPFAGGHGAWAAGRAQEALR